MGDRKLRKEVEKIAQNIGTALLHLTSKHIKQKKIALLFRRLQYPINVNKHRVWLDTEDNKLLYIKETYEAYKKRSRGKNRRQIKELRKELNQGRKKVTQGVESIERAEEKLKTQYIRLRRVQESPGLKYHEEKKLEALQDEIDELKVENERWERAIQRLKFKISSLKEEQERKGHKEARKRTLEYLAKKTGVRVSNRSFEKILAVANQRT